MNKRSIFMLKETITGSWCISAKHESFSHNFDNASIFLQRKNAEKAVKEILAGLGSPQFSTWYYEQDTCVISQEAYDHYVDRARQYNQSWVPELRPMKLEVVEFEINEK